MVANSAVSGDDSRISSSGLEGSAVTTQFQDRGGAVPPSLEAVYEQSADFVWLSLQRLGVRPSDLDDLCHDVFLIVHRKLHEFDGRTKINAWLFGICMRVVANYRRRAYIRLEHSAGNIDEDDVGRSPGEPRADPHEELARREAETKVQAILDRMDLSKRAVFLMFEIEGIACQDIASQLGVPVGTVYSRLHAARQFFAEEAKKQREAESGGSGGRDE
jgi:RNA polymerase sigma-70 factor (ECF subfamily)